MKHLFTLLLMLCPIAMVGCGGPAGPSDTAKQFLTAMEENDVDKVKELAPGMGMLGDQKLPAAISMAATEAAKKGGIEHIEVTDEQITGNTAIVKFVVNYGDGTSDDEEEMELVKVKDKWTVSMGEDSNSKPAGMGGGLGGSGGLDFDLSDDDTDDQPGDPITNGGDPDEPAEEPAE